MICTVLPPVVAGFAGEYWPLIVIAVVVAVLVWVNHRLQRRMRRITGRWRERNQGEGIQDV